MKYVTSVPKKIPAGMVLCHNPVRTVSENQRSGVDGFRLFIEDADQCVECRCGWEPERAPHHYMTKAAANTPRGRLATAPGLG